MSNSAWWFQSLDSMSEFFFSRPGWQIRYLSFLVYHCIFQAWKVRQKLCEQAKIFLSEIFICVLDIVLLPSWWSCHMLANIYGGEPLQNNNYSIYHIIYHIICIIVICPDDHAARLRIYKVGSPCRILISWSPATQHNIKTSLLQRLEAL